MVASCQCVDCFKLGVVVAVARTNKSSLSNSSFLLPSEKFLADLICSSNADPEHHDTDAI